MTTIYQKMTTLIALWLRYWADCLSPGAGSGARPKKQHHLQKCRERKNDIWLTPECVAIDHIESLDEQIFMDAKWVDPFKNTGNYYNNFPTEDKDWCEILRGKDALKYDYADAVVCSNPPYSIINKLLNKMADDRAYIISFLVMTNHITCPRMEMMKKKGYVLASMKFYNIKGYMNTAVAITWRREDILLNDYEYLEFKYKKGGFVTEGEPDRD